MNPTQQILQIGKFRQIFNQIANCLQLSSFSDIYALQLISLKFVYPYPYPHLGSLFANILWE